MMMKTHWIFFSIAAGIDAVLIFLTVESNDISNDLKRAHGGKLVNSPQALRYKIAITFFSLFQSFCWFIVNIFILLVFIRYGKPVEQDAMKILRDKLEAVYRKEQAAALDPEARNAKRQKALDELVDNQIESILRTMVSYKRDNNRLMSGIYESPNPYSSRTDSDRNK